MIRIALGLALWIIVASGAWAQIGPSGCVGTAASPCTTTPAATTPPYTGNGALSVTTSPAALSTMTVNSGGAALPTTFVSLAINVDGSGAIGLCPKGPSGCTCPVNGVANTNGVTILGSGGGRAINLTGIAPSAVYVVACSSTTTTEFQW